MPGTRLPALAMKYIPLPDWFEVVQTICRCRGSAARMRIRSATTTRGASLRSANSPGTQHQYHASTRPRDSVKYPACLINTSVVAPSFAAITFAPTLRLRIK
jgi:hypothetical protein